MDIAHGAGKDIGALLAKLPGAYMAVQPFS